MDNAQEFFTGEQEHAGEPYLLPSGTVTFLFTDIEGSTRLLEQLREGYVQLLAEQRQLLRTCFQKWRGHEIDTQGDSFFVAFGRATDAIACVIEAQRCLYEHAWPKGVNVRVRMGLHTGEPVVAHTGYVGMDVHRAARVASAGHGGQVLLSQATRELVYQELPEGTKLRDLGEHKLKDIRFPQQLFQLDIDGLPCDFPPLKTQTLAEELPTPGKPPFKGLQYFDETDADLFFGRGQVTARLVEAANQQRFLAVIGASGSGKSSVVRAGLVPAIKLSQPGYWETFILTPSAQPLESLAVALTRGLKSITACTALLDDLHKELRTLHMYARKQLTGSKKKWLLVVDQFEELFTLCQDTTERKAFVDNLLYAVQSPDDRVHVLITLRADFYQHLAEYTGLREAVAKHQEYLGAMSAVELRQAIEEPARLGGWEFTLGLVDLMLHEVGAEGGRHPEPGALPLLSHALLETWNHRRGNLMNLKAYAESGGVHQAIARTAERVYSQELSPAQQQIARNIFLRLTQLGEGEGYGVLPSPDTRRRISLHELIPPGPALDAEQIQAVLVKLADARLVITGEGTVEVAHEALIREWPTLRDWLDSGREGIRLHRHITEAAQEWELLDHDPGALYRGTRLSQAMEWALANPRFLNAQEQSYLEASQQATELEQAESEAQRQRELDAARKLAETEKGRAEAERQRAEEQTRSARRLQRRAWQLAGVLALALILAAAAVIFGRQAEANSRLANQNMVAAQSAEQRALGQQATAESERFRAEGEANQRATAEAVALKERGMAEQQARLAFSRELAAASVNNLEIDSQRSLLLAMQAVKTYDNSQAENALHQAIRGSRLRDSISMNKQPLFGVAFSPDGRHIAAASMDGTVYIWAWDASGLKLDRASLRTISNPIDFDAFQTTGYTLAFSPDGKWLAGISAEKTAKIWDFVSGELIQTISGHTGNLISLAYSPDGKLLVTGSADATVKVWDAATGEELQTLTGFANWIEVVVFSPDGRYLAAGSDDGQSIVWKVAGAPENHVWFSELFRLESRNGYMSSLAFSPDSKKLATGSVGDLRVYDIQAVSANSSPVELINIYAHKNTINGLYFNRSGDRLFSGSWDGVAKGWDSKNGQELFTLSGNAGGVLHIAPNPQGTRLLTANYDGSLKVWDITDAGDQEWFKISGNSGFVCLLSADGTKFVTVRDFFSSEPKILIWGLTPTGSSLTPIKELVVPFLYGGDVDASFTRSVLLTEDKTAHAYNLQVWDLSSNQKINEFQVFKSTSESGEICTPGVDCISAPKLSPDGTRIIILSDTAKATLWDVMTGEEIREFALSPGGYSNHGYFSFSPDGSQLATAERDGIARVRDILNGSVLMEFKGHTANVQSATFSPDGKHLLTTSDDRTAMLWDVQTGKKILTLTGHTSNVMFGAFSPDGKYLATSGADGIVKVWDAVTGKEIYSFVGSCVQFAPDSKHIITAHTDGVARGYILDINELVALARSRLIRTWTTEECQKFLHTDICPPTP